jgi:hypothetical protein
MQTWTNNDDTTMSTIVVGDMRLMAVKQPKGWKWSIAPVEDPGTLITEGERRSLASAREAASTWLALSLTIERDSLAVEVMEMRGHLDALTPA